MLNLFMQATFASIGDDKRTRTTSTKRKSDVTTIIGNFVINASRDSNITGNPAATSTAEACLLDDSDLEYENPLEQYSTHI